MKETIKMAMMKLLESADSNASIEFEYRNKNSTKRFTARISNEGALGSIISLASYDGYNKNYITSKLQSHYYGLRNSQVWQIQSGDIILTRHFSSPPRSGKIVTLRANTYYYSVNGGLMSCNGELLGKDYKASFIKMLNAKCSANSEIAQYSQFKLL